MKKAWKFGVFLGVLLLCDISFADNLIGKSVPGITIRQWVTKNPPDIKNLAGRVYVLEFWATWCSPCVKNIPHLIKLNNRYKRKGLEVVALSQDKSAGKLARFVRDKSINYHVAIDNGTVDRFKVTGYPTVFVVNHLGKVVWQGYPWDVGFERAIAAAVAKGPRGLLAGLDLGFFSNLDESLSGGRDFAKAYRKIQSCARNGKKPRSSAQAKHIIQTVNKRIGEKLTEAEHLRTTEPLKAHSLYTEIVAQYGGIEIVKPAKAALIKLENSEQFKKETLVAKQVSEAF